MFFYVIIYSMKAIQQNSHITDSFSCILNRFLLMVLSFIFLILPVEYIQFQENESTQPYFSQEDNEIQCVS